jgi:hypothetical protein
VPLIRKRTTMTANGEAFPLQGDQFEILGYDAYVEFAVLADAGATVRGTIYSGSDLLMQQALVDILAVASPILYPDHYNLNDVAAKDERLSVALLEGAAGTPIVRTQVKITPAA